jgi:flagellar basal-body rod protein FlgB
MTSGPPMMAMLESYLKLSASREQAISANMANVDTGESVQLTPVVRQVQGLMERPDGNNVSLDYEGLKLAKTQLQYQLAIQLIEHNFHQTLSAISGGS